LPSEAPASSSWVGMGGDGFGGGRGQSLLPLPAGASLSTSSLRPFPAPYATSASNASLPGAPPRLRCLWPPPPHWRCLLPQGAPPLRDAAGLRPTLSFCAFVHRLRRRHHFLPQCHGRRQTGPLGSRLHPAGLPCSVVTCKELDARYPKRGRG
jgi:hypothetical protein